MSSSPQSDHAACVGPLLDRVPLHGACADYVRQAMRDKLIEHKQYITEHGENLPEIRNWTWPGARR
ncbi:MAG: hypothetical protein HOP35_14470 [Nitrospira sp.]|nr:hypothetical protein [Nitrospira sp.]